MENTMKVNSIKNSCVVHYETFQCLVTTILPKYLTMFNKFLMILMGNLVKIIRVHCHYESFIVNSTETFTRILLQCSKL